MAIRSPKLCTRSVFTAMRSNSPEVALSTSITVVPRHCQCRLGTELEGTVTRCQCVPTQSSKAWVDRDAGTSFSTSAIHRNWLRSQARTHLDRDSDPWPGLPYMHFPTALQRCNLSDTVMQFLNPRAFRGPHPLFFTFPILPNRDP
jgi:hypothetical protein